MKITILIDFVHLKSKSQDSFKKMVKEQAKKNALRILKEKQAKHTKIQNVEYSELKIQEYFLLPGIKVDEARNIFMFRIRMATVGKSWKSILRLKILMMMKSVWKQVRL